MPIGKPKPTEYVIDNLKLKIFFDEKFVELLEKKIKNVKFSLVFLNIVEKKEMEQQETTPTRLFLGHETKEAERDGITTVGASKSGICDAFLEVIQEFVKEKECSD